MTRGTSVRLGPVTLDDGELIMRSPRLRDAETWTAARLSNRKWLERAFPAWGDDWAAEQSTAAWVERLRQLRREQHRGACPLVVFLDGQLIGEIGIDSVDTATGTGEASAWLTREHGSPDVMIAASALLIRHVFDRVTPLDRIVSPVATSSRRGRSPGLSAVGFGIEATVPRPLGHGETVDHDMWIVHNTPDTRSLVRQVLADVDRGSRPAITPPTRPSRARLTSLVPAMARVAVRNGRRSVRGAGTSPAPRRVNVTGGVIEVATDVGTATTTFVPRLDAETGFDEITATIGRLADTEARSAQVQRVEVRLAPTVAEVASGLTRFGFTHVATYRANPAGPNAYAGEQVWSRSTR